MSGWQQTENSLKPWIRTFSNLIELIQFHLICQMLAKFSKAESERNAFKFRKRKRKRKFCVVFTYSIKQAREIRKFHVAVDQRRLRNVQKSVKHVQSCCFAKGQVIRATFSHNLSRNIVALQVEKRCFPYYHPRSQLVTQQILMLQVVATYCAK